MFISGSLFANELQLLVESGVCFELSTKDANKDFKLYLFPSLGSIGMIHWSTQQCFIANPFFLAHSISFTLLPNPRFSLYGVQITAPGGKVFVPGFLCKFIVTLCSEFHVSRFLFHLHCWFLNHLKIYHHEIIKIYSNAILLACSGVTDGQLMVYANPKEFYSTIKIVAMATNPSVEQVITILREMVNDHFSSCILFLYKTNIYIYDTI